MRIKSQTRECMEKYNFTLKSLLMKVHGYTFCYISLEAKALV